MIRAAQGLREHQKDLHITFNNESVSSITESGGNKTSSLPKYIEHTWAINELHHPITIKNTGNQPISYVLSLQGEPISYQKFPQKGFIINREILTASGQPADIKQLKSGELYVVLIKGKRTHKEIKHVIMVDLLPAGFEIENAKLSDQIIEQQFAWLGPITAASRTSGQFVYPAVYTEAMYQPQYFTYGTPQTIQIASDLKK